MDSSGRRERCLRRLTWGDLDPAAVQHLIELARLEDLEGWGLRTPPERFGDATTRLMPAGATGTAHLVAREALVLSGLPLVERVLQAYAGEAGAHFEAAAGVGDGQRVVAGTRIGSLAGSVRVLLEAERVLLNFLQRLSGVATQTARYVEALGDSPTRLLDTRKTTPGYRMLEKYAVACGGGWNHRLGLFDRVMLKDNHLEITGDGDGLAERVAESRRLQPELAIEIEVDRPEQIEAALAAGADILLLDNFTTAQLAAAVEQIGGRALTEASGGIQIERLPELATLGLDFISTGALVHQAAWRDIGLDWD